MSGKFADSMKPGVPNGVPNCERGSLALVWFALLTALVYVAGVMALALIFFLTS